MGFPVELQLSNLINNANLKCYYRFEGNSNDGISSRNGTDTDISYGTSYGRFIQGALFNGSSSKIVVPNNADWKCGFPFTMGAWVYLDSVSGTYNICCTDETGVGGLYAGVTLRVVDGNVQVRMGNNAGSGESSRYSTTTDTTPISAEEWFFVVITAAAYNDVTIYVNGASQTTTNAGTATSMAYSTSDSAVGVFLGTSYFDGYIDELFIFDDELTSGEVLGLYSASAININDELGISDGMSSSADYILGLNDTLAVDASVASSFKLFLDLNDVLTIDEGIEISYGFKSILSDTIPVAESVTNSTTLGLSESVSIDTTLIEISKEEGLKLTTGWRFLVRNSSGDYIASLVNARDRWFREALNHGGSAGFILDSTDENCNSTVLAPNANELIVEYKGFKLFGGQISAIRKVANGNDIYWEVVAKQFFNLFEKRFCGYNKSTGLSDPREFTTTDAGTIAWTLIDESQDEVNGDFGITQGNIGVSLNRTKSFERKNIAEAILELADNDYGFDFEITPNKVFNVYYPMKGTVRDDVVFRYPGNCLDFDCLEDGWDVVNHELGLGRHWGGTEIVYVGDDATSQAAYGKREKIASHKDMELLAYLTDMVTMDIDWLKDIHKVIKFKSFIDTKTELYLYELGDLVRVVADDFGVNEQLYVYERQVSIDGGDVATVTLTLGD